MDRKAEMERGVDLSNNIDLLSKFLMVTNPDGSPKFNDSYLLDIMKNFLLAGRGFSSSFVTTTIIIITTLPRNHHHHHNHITVFLLILAF